MIEWINEWNPLNSLMWKNHKYNYSNHFLWFEVELDRLLRETLLLAWEDIKCETSCWSQRIFLGQQIPLQIFSRICASLWASFRSMILFLKNRNSNVFRKSMHTQFTNYFWWRHVIIMKVIADVIVYWNIEMILHQYVHQILATF